MSIITRIFIYTHMYVREERKIHTMGGLTPYPTTCNMWPNHVKPCQHPCKVGVDNMYDCDWVSELTKVEATWYLQVHVWPNILFWNLAFACALWSNTKVFQNPNWTPAFKSHHFFKVTSWINSNSLIKHIGLRLVGLHPTFLIYHIGKWPPTYIKTCHVDTGRIKSYKITL